MRSYLIAQTEELRELKSLLKRIRSQQIESDRSTNRQNSTQPTVPSPNLLGRLRWLYKRLRYRIPIRTLRRAVGGMAFLFAACSFSLAQTSFSTATINPMGLTNVGTQVSPVFTDLDGDNDWDVLVGRIDGQYSYWRNTGTPTSPSFVVGPFNPFQLIDIGTGNSPTLVDLNNDGDMDLMTGEGLNLIGFYFYDNEGTVTQPDFAQKVPNPYGLTFNEFRPTPAFADIDNDGDYDMLSGDFDGDFYYYENTGTSTFPAFAAPVLNPWGLANIGDNDSAPEFVDLDQDGDMDLFSGSYTTGIYYYENTGSISSPAFGPKQTSPFGISFTGMRPTIAAGDLDGDLDADLLVGTVSGDLYYFENTTPVGIEDGLGIEIDVWPNPAHDRISVDIPGLSISPYEVSISNTLGQVVWSQSYDGGTDNLNLELKELQTGVYWLRVSQENKQIVRRFVKD